MKQQAIQLGLLLSLFSTALSVSAQRHDHQAETGGDHRHQQVAPNGGRMILSIEPHCEFLVLENRHVQLTFLSEEGAPLPPGNRQATAICGDRHAPTHLTFKTEGNRLVSEQSIPDGNNIPLILTLKIGDNGAPIRERLKVNLSHCAGCNLQEYACTCGH